MRVRAIVVALAGTLAVGACEVTVDRSPSSDAGAAPWDGAGPADASPASDAAGQTDSGDSGPIVPDASFPADPAFYNFETGTQGWTASGQATAAAAGGVEPFAGMKSLEVQLSGQGQGSASVADPPVPAGATVTFHVWMPASSLLTGV